METEWSAIQDRGIIISGGEVYASPESVTFEGLELGTRESKRVGGFVFSL